MPTLQWIGKEKVINHHHDVPFRVLQHEYRFPVLPEAVNTGNRIIRGDNLEALKSLLPEYEGRIKCIYIDPPYNTGKNEWKYNDNVDHPRIREWLNKFVEREDLNRHDKWLCMMYPRLELLKKLLAGDGVIFISIDDNELFYLKVVMDEIFGMENFTGNIIWETATDNNPTQVSVEHEYILCYARNHDQQNKWTARSQAADLIQAQYLQLKEAFGNDTASIQKALRKWIRSNKEKLPQATHYDNVDEKGVFHDADVANTKFGGYEYEIVHPVTGKACKIPEKGYRYPETSMKELIARNDVMFGEDETTLVKPKKRLEEVKERLRSVIYEDGRASTKELEKMFRKDFFKNPKSETVLRHILKFCTSGNDIILDCFAGSGTTAHAVLNLNRQDGGNRKFLLIEMEDYAESITAERVKKVITGYGDAAGPECSFDFFTLGETLFTGDRQELLNTTVDMDKIREYVWYSETRSPLPASTVTDPYYLGLHEDTAYYFLYEKDDLTTLDFDFLGSVSVKAGQYVFYASNCLLPSEFMLEHNIIFKKVSRDIKRF